MTHPAIRITFIDEEAARRRWEGFGDGLGSELTNFARKRDGASHVLLLRGLPEDDARRVAAWCTQQPDVVAVTPIAEDLFWSARSNVI
jgi:hypothetical protein